MLNSYVRSQDTQPIAQQSAGVKHPRELPYTHTHTITHNENHPQGCSMELFVKAKQQQQPKYSLAGERLDCSILTMECFESVKVMN